MPVAHLIARRLPALLFSLALLASSLAPVHAQDTSGLTDVHATYHDLQELFYRPLDPGDLLQAGWAALGADAARRGVPAPEQLPSLSPDPQVALDAFDTAYTGYLASLPASFTGSLVAADINKGMADSVREQHTHYLPAATMQRFLQTVGGGQQATGLGIRLGGDQSGAIVDVAPGSPAATAGLQPGDVIVGADNTDLTNADAQAVAMALVGPAGSTVDLSIDRGNGPQHVSVTRGAYYFPPLTSRVLPEGVGYLRLSDFVISGTPLPDGTELLSDLDNRLDQLDAQGAQGLVLDLRGNGGGSVQTADEVLGRFLPETVRSVHESDQRGHDSYELASGRVHARQLPMAVLINAGSASASEITASALRDGHRAIVVGQKSAGAVASSELLPLPGGGGLQIAVAAASSGESGADLDGVGITPDVLATDNRSVADYRAGRDPQLAAAVAALASAPTPPAATSGTTGISPADLDRLLEAVLPGAGDLPTNDRLTATTRWQRLDYLHPNELIDQNGGAPDPVGLAQTLRGRGYQGSVVASYGAAAGDLPTLGVDADLYATTEGAHSAASTNDLPALQLSIPPQLQAGDETVEYRGAWLGAGSTSIVWRRGRLVLTVTYSDAPGLERPETLAAITQLVDARAQQLSIP